MPSSLQALVTECAHALGDGGVYAVASGSATTVVSAALFNATLEASEHLHDGDYACLSNDQQRTVRPGGYDPATGTLTIFPDWGSVLSTLVLFVTHVFPAIDAGDGPSYRSLINLALSRLAYPDYVELAITDAEFYSTAAYPWLDRESRLLDVLEPGVRGGRPVSCMWRVRELVLDGPTPGVELNAPFENATGTLTLKVLRPAHTLIETSGTWAENTAGLASFTDRAKVETGDVIPAFLYVAYRALTARSPGRPYPKAAELADYWLGEARRSRVWDTTQDTAAPQPAPTGAAA